MSQRDREIVNSTPIFGAVAGVIANTNNKQIVSCFTRLNYFKNW